jgi:hypothetical protein
MAPKTRVTEADIEPVPPGPELRLFVTTDHDKHSSGGKVASYALARDEAHAKALIDASLIRAGLRPHSMWRYRLESHPLNKPIAEVLNDGDY